MKSLTKWLMLGATTSVLGGMLYADPTAPTTAAPTTDSASATKRMSPAEMQDHMATLESHMKNDYLHVMHLKGVAEQRRDVIRVNCVNDKLVSIKAQLNIADNTGINLKASLARNGDDRFALYDAYSGAAAAVKGVREDANTCVGELEIVSQVGGQEVHHPIIPDDPATSNPFTYSHEIEPPAYASPFD